MYAPNCEPEIIRKTSKSRGYILKVYRTGPEKRLVLRVCFDPSSHFLGGQFFRQANKEIFGLSIFYEIDLLLLCGYLWGTQGFTSCQCQPFLRCRPTMFEMGFGTESFISREPSALKQHQIIRNLSL